MKQSLINWGPHEEDVDQRDQAPGWGVFLGQQQHDVVNVPKWEWESSDGDSHPGNTGCMMRQTLSQESSNGDSDPGNTGCTAQWMLSQEFSNGDSQIAQRDRCCCRSPLMETLVQATHVAPRNTMLSQETPNLA